MKYFVAAILVILAVNASSAQTKLGLKLTSSIITQRTSFQNDSANITKGPNTLVPSAMLFADFLLSRNYYFSTGIGYISKRVNLKAESISDNHTISKSYNIQYIQIPATLKLYTSEVALDKKLYFQFGPVFDIAVHTKEKDSNLKLIDQFQPVDITLLFGCGMDFQVAPNTSIQVGISYGRGLINTIKSINVPGNLVVKNDLYCVDIAVKF